MSKTIKSKKPGLSLLGKTVSNIPSAPTAATLETFANAYARRDYWIRFESGDFTSLCPVTGQPDFAAITVDYVPDKLCIETKSFKFYLASFRNTRRFNEEIVNRILEDLVAACAPRQLWVYGEFASRGGIGVTVEAFHPATALRPQPAARRPPRGMKVVVLLSGGMDSVTALYEARESHEVVGGVSFHYGSKHNDREIPFAAYHARKLGVAHRVIPLAFIGELFKSDLLASQGEIPKGHYEEEMMKKTVVPFRNGIMLSIAAGYAESLEAEGLVIAAHAGDHAIYPDCREDFMKSMGDAIRLGTYAGVEVLRPFIAMTKADIARRGGELDVDYAQTWSCYVGGETHCGECGTCVERREAFLLSGVADPTRYVKTGPLPAKPVSEG